MVWTHIIIEGYCLYESMSKKFIKTHKVIFDKNNEMKVSKKLDINTNKNYISKSERPKWCKNNNKKLVPKFRCMCNGKKGKKCPFFGYTNADKNDYILFEKAYEKEHK